MLKQDSKYCEHFYHLLQPWVHFVTVRRDITDLEKKLQWAIDNDDKVKKEEEESTKYGTKNAIVVSLPN